MTSTRALTRALGLSHLTPANVVKQVSGTNFLAYGDYVSFWNSIQRTQSGATKMMTELLLKFVELEKQHFKRLRGNTKDSVKESERAERLLWMIINTLRFLDLFLGVEANNPNLRKAQRAYESHRSECPAGTASAREMDAFLKTVFRSVFEMADTTNALVMELAFVNSVEWTLESGGTRDLSFSVLRDCPFIGLRLMAKVGTGGRESYTVFSEMAKQLASMPNMIRAQPALMNSTLGNVLALLFLIKEALSFYPVIDRQLLQKLADAVMLFQSWPLPYGAFAKSLIQTIATEMRSPGASLRARVRSENPLLTDYGEHQAEKYGSQGVDWASAHRIVTVLHNSGLSRSHLMRKLISKALFKNKAWTNEMHQCREEILTMLIEATFVSTKDDGVQWHNNVVAALRNRHQADMADWYQRAMRCVDHQTNEVDATALHQVLRDIAPSLAEVVHARVAQQRDADANDIAGGEEDEEDDILTELETIKKEPFDPALWSVTVPRLPFLSFEFLEIFSASQRRAMTQEGGLLRGGGPPVDDDEDLGSTLFAAKGRGTGNTKSRRAKTRASLTIPGLDTFSLNPAFEGEVDAYGIKGQHQVPQKYLAYPSDFEELVKDARLMLPPEEALHPGSRASFAMMTGAAQSTLHSKGKAAQGKGKQKKEEKTNMTVLGKPALRRVILGGLDVLHRALCTYVALLAVDPQLASKVEFCFYLVPLGKNDLASFIAQRDGWYRKHVFVPFHAPLMLVPQCKADLSGASAGNDDAFGTDSTTSASQPRATGLMTPKNNITSPSNNRRTSLMGKLAPPSNFDSDYGGDSDRNMGDDDILDSLEDPSGGFNALASDMPQRKHRLDATPAKLLRPLMENYIRGAKSVFPVTVYDCECWESPDAIEVDRNPDVTVPFCVRVELGLGAAVAAHTSSLEFTTNAENRTSGDGLGPELGFDELLNDKTFIKAISGNNPDLKISTPELTVSMYTMGIDGTLDDRYVLELADSHYLSLIIASVPKFTFPSESNKNSVGVEVFEPPATAANPVFPWLEVQSVAAKANGVELIKKKDKKPKDIDAIQDMLKYESKTHHIGFLDIRSTLASRVPFLIAVDGQTFGPYYRVRVRRSTALSTSGGQAVMANSPQVLFPIMTFLPTVGNSV